MEIHPYNRVVPSYIPPEKTVEMKKDIYDLDVVLKNIQSTDIKDACGNTSPTEEFNCNYSQRCNTGTCGCPR